MLSANIYLTLGTGIVSLNRQTKQREAILRLLRGTASHPTADQIYDQVRKEMPRISKGTVYRNLKVLREMGLVAELNLDGTVGRFEAKQESHYHFRCEECGRVFDVDEPVDKELDRKVALRTGLKISHHQLEFHGLCHDCQNR
jgi:Fur family peroxide stress response transcriptional regulator